VDVFIARQAILDREQGLFAYELLFRSCSENYAGIKDDSASTLQVLSTTLLSAGLSILSEFTPVFINFGRELLLSTWPSLLPASSVVVEILESVQADPEVLAACLVLKQKGYALALDDVTEQSSPEFLKLADIIKVDFRATSPEVQARLVREHRSQGRRLLAEKVETREEFERAKELGYDFFQGFFFSKPVLMQGRQVTAMKASVLKLLAELGSPEINFGRLEALIRCDVSLTYKLLRYVNSALFGRRQPLSGILPALVAMGELDIRRWIVLATLLDLSGTTQVLARHALLRARFCESVAAAAGSSAPGDAFLMGMFSLLDALVHRPLPEALKELGLPAALIAPLLGKESTSKNASSLTLARCYEAGDWEGVSLSAKILDLQNEKVPVLYVEAVEWVSQVLMAGGAAPSLPPSGERPVRDLLALNRAVQPTSGTRIQTCSPSLARSSK
jgi:c-di-GMP-related signal transduction protein